VWRHLALLQLGGLIQHQDRARIAQLASARSFPRKPTQHTVNVRHQTKERHHIVGMQTTPAQHPHNAAT
jgi:hypothetical protein